MAETPLAIISVVPGESSARLDVTESLHERIYFFAPLDLRRIPATTRGMRR